MSKINELPAPVKLAAGLLPGVGWALNGAEQYKWTVVKLAAHYESQGRLSARACDALASYQRALAREQRAYEQLLRSLTEVL